MDTGGEGMAGRLTTEREALLRRMASTAADANPYARSELLRDGLSELLDEIDALRAELAQAQQRLATPPDRQARIDTANSASRSMTVQEGALRGGRR